MRKWLAAAIALLFLSCDAPLGGVPLRAAAQETADMVTLPRPQAEEGSYGAYLQEGAYPPAAGEPLELPAAQAVRGEEEEAGQVFPYLEWRFSAPQAGRYTLLVRYRCTLDRSTAIERRLRVNGVIPYSELDGFTLPREYRNAGAPRQDIYGNDIKPEQVPADRRIENRIFDYAGNYSEPLSVNIEQGDNTLRLVELAETADIDSLCLEPAGAAADYATVLAAHRARGVPDYAGKAIPIEAETASYKSDTTLYPISDRTSPLTSPCEPGKVRLNAIGGYRWNTVGQYLTWTVDAPEEGLYALSFKARQNVANGQISSRRLTINGQLPFAEAAHLRFRYDASWQMVTAGDERGPYLFYFRKGSNELRLQATLGETDEAIRLLDTAVRELNTIYRKLLIVIGSQPDTARDYKLDKTVPEQIEAMRRQAAVLASCADWFETFTGQRSSGTGLMRTIVRQLEAFVADTDKVARDFSYFKTNIGALGTWLYTAKQQPLELDYMLVGTGSDLPDVNAGFFSQLGFDLTEFAHSFVIDYRTMGEMEAAGDSAESSLRVWIASGRDQAQIIRNMINDQFTPQRGVHVRLELVAGGTLLPATVAGIGPDMTIGGDVDVFNFAMRGAAHDLKGYPDFDEVAGRFLPASFIPLRYREGVYALPETVSFSVLFYRHDILDELRLKVPDTWDDLIAMSSVLAKNNMEIGLPAGHASYLLLLKQHGLDIYEGGGETCALDGVEAIDVFQYYTNFYANYGFPLSYDFVNRFRSGEMPVAIDSFAMFNNLQVAAPEIKGLWDFAVLPSSVDRNGRANRTSLVSGAAALILENGTHHEQAWQFLKWWTDAPTQVRYGKEIESLLGPSARYSSANTAAFAQSSWSKANMQVLLTQMESLDAVEPVPGGYFLTRHLDNAFRAVVYRQKRPMDTLFDYVYKIDQELTEKRREFGLSTAPAA